MTCPICLAHDVYASHRRGPLERGPLTWVGLLPFRCAQCQRRFFRFAPRDPRRRRGDDVKPPQVDRLRPPRWSIGGRATVTPTGPGQGGSVVQGRIENASLKGIRVRLPVALKEGSHITVTLEGDASRRGTVRWQRPQGETGILHGIQFETPLKRGAAYARPFRQARMRQILRRCLILLIGTACMALVAYSLVSLLEAMRRYNPNYYEPKDIERYLHQGGQELPAGKKQP